MIELDHIQIVANIPTPHAPDLFIKPKWPNITKIIATAFRLFVVCLLK